MGLDRAANTALLAESCERIRAAGLHPCVYCSAGWADARIDTAALEAPLWIAWYYSDPADPDFGGCTPLESLPGKWGDYLRGLGQQLCALAVRRIGYGGQYGVGSANVDRDWICYQPGEEETPMNLNRLPASSCAAPARKIRSVRLLTPRTSTTAWECWSWTKPMPLPPGAAPCSWRA